MFVHQCFSDHHMSTTSTPPACANQRNHISVSARPRRCGLSSPEAPSRVRSSSAVAAAVASWLRFSSARPPGDRFKARATYGAIESLQDRAGVEATDTLALALPRPLPTRRAPCPPLPRACNGLGPITALSPTGGSDPLRALWRGAHSPVQASPSCLPSERRALPCAIASASPVSLPLSETGRWSAEEASPSARARAASAARPSSFPVDGAETPLSCPARPRGRAIMSSAVCLPTSLLPVEPSTSHTSAIPQPTALPLPTPSGPPPPHSGSAD